MKQGLTEIIVVLDRSGSMASMRVEAIGGYNNFLADQKALPGKANWTLVQFDDQYEKRIDGKPIADVPNLSQDTFVPRGMTALLDATGRTITEVGQRLANMPEEERPEKVALAILTDGEENASKEYTAEKVKDMIRHQEEKYGWLVMFLASDINAAKFAVATMGVSDLNAKFDKSHGELYRSLNAQATSFRTGR
jgi:uncharacterized protein YegL